MGRSNGQKWRLHSGIGVKAKANLDLLQLIAGVLLASNGRWVIGGDFNCTPDELEKSGWLRMINGVVVSPQVHTNGVRCIDFFVVSAALQHMVVGWCFPGC